MPTVDEFIEHFGKKGMKWGVRTRVSKNKGKTASTKPKAKDLSDDDLKRAVNRMQMERQYNSLTNNSTKSKGAQFVKGIGSNAVKTALTAVATQQVAKALQKANISK